ncbi:MAG: hypothetical protein AABX55_00530 [Nanoarchaeota archaeon]
MEQENLEKGVTSISHINISISQLLDRMNGEPVSKVDLERFKTDYNAEVEFLDYEHVKGAILKHPNLEYICSFALGKDKLYHLVDKVNLY